MLVRAARQLTSTSPVENAAGGCAHAHDRVDRIRVDSTPFAQPVRARESIADAKAAARGGRRPQHCLHLIRPKPARCDLSVVEADVVERRSDDAEAAETVADERGMARRISGSRENSSAALSATFPVGASR